VPLFKIELEDPCIPGRERELVQHGGGGKQKETGQAEAKKDDFDTKASTPYVYSLIGPRQKTSA